MENTANNGKGCGKGHTQQTDESEDVVIIGEKTIAAIDGIDLLKDTKSPKYTNALQMDKSYVQILNEMFPNQTSYVEEGCTGPQHRPLFRIGVHVCGLTFHGLSYTKQKARHEAAKEAIAHFRGRPDTNVGFSNDMRYHRDHNYRRDRYQPYNRLQGFQDRWGRAVPFGSNPYDSYYRPNSHYICDDFYESQYSSQRHRNYTPLYYRERRITAQQRPDPQQYQRSVTEMALNFKTKDNSRIESNSNTCVKQNEEKRNDFTADDYNDDSFVEFNERADNKEDSTEQMPTEMKCPHISKPKERIILRVMSETPVNLNPVSVIHELQPNAKWVSTELTTKKHSTTFEMRLLLPLANQCFIGTAKTKKLAKAEAASKALLELYNISLTAQNSDNCDVLKPKSTVQIAQEPLLLKQDIANRVGAAVMSKCSEVWDKLIDIKKWTVLSAIVLTDDMNVDFVDVICLTSGTKCVKGDNLSMNGYALNDCHAEVLARRSFLYYIYQQIEALIDNNFEDKPEFILERRPDRQGYRIKTSIKLNLFISTAPCGDSRVFSPKEEAGDAHPNRQTRGLLRAKIEGGEGTIPLKRDSIQTWDGILQGHQRLQFMSCSDKIAVWNVVGIQGALLSHLIEPIYLSSVVLASLFNYEHLVRALHGRFHLNFDSNSLKGLPQTYGLNKCKVAKCQLNEDITRQLTKAPNYALNWIKGDDRPEVVSTESGRIHIENTVSRLAKRSLFGRFCALLGRNTPVLANCCLAQNIPVVYRDGKTASLQYQRTKTQCMQTFQEQNLGNWLQVPAEIDLFTL